MIIAAMLALLAGQAMAQRCLPGMSAVEVKADMADGYPLPTNGRLLGIA